VEGFKLRDCLQTVRTTLLHGHDRDRLDKPLAYWALPGDRRLPVALLDRSVRRLLETPFEELIATPGIGQKKIASLVTLLRRAAQGDVTPEPIETGKANGEASQAVNSTDGESTWDFHPDFVSESRWETWCETVRRHSMGHERLGMLAPSLQELPTVIWHTPLSFYHQRSVAEIRDLKTHGEKRVRAVLQVFHAIHGLLRDSTESDSLGVRIAPRFVPPLEEWIVSALDRAAEAEVDDGEIREHLVEPILWQIKVDAGDAIYGLVCSRLGEGEVRRSVRELATELGVTRARVYQLLDHCCQIMEVRWPDGARLLRRLARQMARAGAARGGLDVLDEVRGLFYPEKTGLRDPENPLD